MKRLAILIWFMTACLPIRQPVLVQQRLQNDCVTAAVAMMADRTYEQVEHFRQALGMPLDEPLAEAEIVRLAGALGLHLHRASFDDRTDEGLVVVNFPDAVYSHAVYVRDGMVYDPGSTKPSAWSVEKPRWQGVAYVLRRY